MLQDILTANVMALGDCRYKHEIRKEDQDALRKLVKTQYHYKVSPEIYRELEVARRVLEPYMNHHE